VLVIGLLGELALAAEVVWTAPPDDAWRARVAEMAGATGPALSPADLRTLGTRWSADDDRALAAVDEVLREVRPYERRLDGELLILRDLAGPIAAVGALRDDADRARLFAALAYQGFAVNRYYGETLGSDEQAAPWRQAFDGQVLELPWVDAAALEPGKEISPYEIAEAPQRVAYERVRQQVGAALPASLVPKNLPPGAALVVDGRESAPGPAGNVKVPPGRHLAHAEVGGQIVARWDVRLAPGESADLVAPAADPAWQAMLADLRPGAALPAELAAVVDGELWIATPAADRGDPPTVVAIRNGAVAPVPLDRAPAPQNRAPDHGKRRGSLALAATGGWFYSGDFYTQNAVEAPHERSTVNAATAGLAAELDLDVGPVRLGVGADAVYTPGPYHVARFGDATTRIRPYPHVAAGLRAVQATAGWVFPQHPAVGLQGAIPLIGPLELVASAAFGLPRSGERSDGSRWDTERLAWAMGGVGARF
jgi:hypothetical protein